MQLGFFSHMQLAVSGAALGSMLTLTRPIVFATAFMLLFSIVIALFKDIPDVAGDRKVSLLGALCMRASRLQACLRLPKPGQTASRPCF